MERRLIAVEGTVQGVGFRPWVHRLAAANSLRGFVRNDAAGVLIDVEGDRHSVDSFCRALTAAPPPLASIARVRIETAFPGVHGTFRIAASEEAGLEPAGAQIPPDVATCNSCLAELRDPSNRRAGHPFITCTDCGPRLTVVRDAPFDRVRTTMAAFAMCSDCKREYVDPDDRRFHAETISCWSCGPVLRAVTGASDSKGTTGRDAVAAAVAALASGRIVAIKALGGYHLACDATDSAAVKRLRARKRREAKPLAVMVRDADCAARLCTLSLDERALLESGAGPIVLLMSRDDLGVAESVAPGQRLLGVMLPSTPLHHLLLAALDRPLVMTSGNRSGEPVVITEPAAFAALADVADLFLVNDRPIAERCDDSVVRVMANGAHAMRRSRGYAPRSIALASTAPAPVLAMGGQLKNTACLISGSSAVLSAHIGDLETVDARTAVRDAVGAMLRRARVVPSVIAHDLHPDYASTHLAHALAAELGVERRIAIQHHHAHVASCVAEHRHSGAVIGVVFDGAGLGTDGAIWGGEFLLVDGADVRRCGHLAYVPLAGGDVAARRPWRSAAAHLAAAGCARAPRPESVPESEWDVVHQLIARCGSVPRTSSVGRLFDAVSSLLGLCHVSRFEGEAAMALEAVAHWGVAPRYHVTITDGAPWTVGTGALISALADDRRCGYPVAASAGAFHVALRDAVVLGCERTREETSVATVALSGGVFVNRLLLELVHDALVARKFRVLLHGDVPCNDGGLSLGQAYVAARAIEGDE